MSLQAVDRFVRSYEKADEQVRGGMVEELLTIIAEMHFFLTVPGAAQTSTIEDVIKRAEKVIRDE